MNNTDLLSIGEAAADLTVRPSCIRRWIREERIAVVHIGRLVRVPRSEVLRIIREGTRPAKKTGGR